VDKRPIDVGLILTPIEDRGGTTTPSWLDLMERAHAAEEVGFESIWISDHLIHRFPGVPDYGIWECWSLVSALAAVTSRVQIGMWVLCTGFRNPALLAKMAETVDEISNGRVILALGSGWHEPEYRAFGFPFDNRVARFEEAITIIHGLLHDGAIDFAGKYYSARDCELRPRGPRPEGLPIMIGTIGGTPLAARMNLKGTSPKMLELVARYAEIWNCPWVNDLALLPGIMEMVDRACLAAGRDPRTLKRSHGAMFNLPGWQDEPGSVIVRQGRAAMGAIEGSPEQLATVLRQYAAAGTNEVHLQLDPETPETIREFGKVLQMLQE
jgi:alkanesulfonate monooxygenase SsuD/methylene tetrahydromethanopterin reductase-like flavin-dependent oxidoreductase (luciferase family)